MRNARPSVNVEAGAISKRRNQRRPKVRNSIIRKEMEVRVSGIAKMQKGYTKKNCDKIEQTTRKDEDGGDLPRTLRKEVCAG